MESMTPDRNISPRREVNGCSCVGELQSSVLHFWTGTGRTRGGSIKSSRNEMLFVACGNEVNLVNRDRVPLNFLPELIRLFRAAG